jgi:hypothetical protein
MTDGRGLASSLPYHETSKVFIIWAAKRLRVGLSSPNFSQATRRYASINYQKLVASHLLEAGQIGGQSLSFFGSKAIAEWFAHWAAKRARVKISSPDLYQVTRGSTPITYPKEVAPPVAEAGEIARQSLSFSDFEFSHLNNMGKKCGFFPSTLNCR